MTEDDIRDYYESIGMEYQAGDWRERAENGESASQQLVEQERIGREWVSALDPHVLTGLERDDGGTVRPVWHPRSAHERELVEALEDFFETHLPALRPEGKQQALEDLMYARASLNELAEDKGVSKQAVSQARKRALTWVMRELSSQWPDPEGSVEARAYAVFAAYWRDRFGVDFPNTEAS